MMRKTLLLSVLTLGLLISSCSDDDNVNATSNLVLNLDGLEELGPNFVYEGWIIIDGAAVSAGRFSSVTFPQSFQLNATALASASTFVLSIEPVLDPDPEPAPTKILVGDFEGAVANVSSHDIVGDFTASSGKYILATPTDADSTNEASGVWFIDNSSGNAVAGLDLPILNMGWTYEGWVVMNGIPVSTGTFRDMDAADDNASTSIFKGNIGDGPPFPGEDYLQNAPTGLNFPTDLKGTTIVISVEPSPDNSAAPFTLKPLAHEVSSNAMNHTTINMGTGPVQSLSGTVTR